MSWRRRVFGFVVRCLLFVKMVKKEEMEDWKREKVQDVQLAVQMKSNSAHRFGLISSFMILS